MSGTYQERAEQADVLARNARSQNERQTLQEIARLWRRLAGNEKDAPRIERRSFIPD